MKMSVHSVRWVTIAGTLLALFLAITSCSTADTASSGAGTPGQPQPGPGFDGQTIALGEITILTGPVAAVGTDISAGQRVYFDRVNANGGIAGKYRVELVPVDTGYDTAKGVQQYSSIKNDVVLLSQVAGTAIVGALLPQLRRDNMVALPSSQDSAWLRERNLMPIGDTSQVEAINAVSWFLEAGGGSRSSKICYAGASNAQGDAGAAGFDFAMEQLRVRPATSVRYDTSAQDFTAPVQRLQTAGCEAVVINSAAAASGKVFGAAAIAGYRPRWLVLDTAYDPSFMTSPIFEYLKSTAVVIGSGTEWGDTSTPGMKRMMDDVATYKPDQRASFYFQFGYNQAWAAHVLLEKAVERGDLSRDGVLAALESLGTVSYGGLSGDFTYGDPARRNTPRASTIFVLDQNVPGGRKVDRPNYVSSTAETFEFAA